jgi:hypothetical protein
LFIARICTLFRERSIPFAIVGGYAVAIHGVARGTFDVDIITEITADNFRKMEEALFSVGMKSIVPVNAAELFANLEIYKKEKNLVAWHFLHPTRMRDSLDIIITDDMRDFEIVEVQSDFGKLPTLSLESLITMKSRVNREQDQKDVAALKLLREKRH